MSEVRESAVPPPAVRLSNPDALLSRSDLAALGWTRAAVDAIFRRLPVVQLEGLRKPMVRVSDYVALVEASTYRGDRFDAESRS
jgi:hypothetical protein